MNNTKEKIIKNALKLFLQKGFDRTSMNDIAKSVDISKPAIYHHFESKEGLANGVLDYFAEVMRDWSIKNFRTCKNTYERIKFSFESIKRFHEVEKLVLGEEISYKYSFNDFIIIASKNSENFRKKMKEIVMRTLEVGKMNIRKGQESGEIRADLDPDIIALQMHSIIEGLSVVAAADTLLNLDLIGAKMFKQFWLQIKK